MRNNSVRVVVETVGDDSMAHRDMYQIWRLCNMHGFEAPDGVRDALGGTGVPHPRGPTSYLCEMEVSETFGEFSDTLESRGIVDEEHFGQENEKSFLVDVRKLPKDVRWLRIVLERNYE